jgi:3-methyladenine DNA glycosylase/8-oxoguanine DNA glycosylase
VAASAGQDAFRQPSTLKKAQKLSDEELVLRLTEVRGIGPWTVQTSGQRCSR